MTSLELKQLQTLAECKANYTDIKQYVSDLKSLNNNVIVLFDSCLDNEQMSTKNQKMRRGFIEKLQDGSFVWTEDYVPILRDQYLEFREAMMSKHFK